MNYKELLKDTTENGNIDSNCYLMDIGENIWKI